MRQSQVRKSFKVGIQKEDCRRKRELESQNIRKQKRENVITARRNILPEIKLHPNNFDIDFTALYQKTDNESIYKTLYKIRKIVSVENPPIYDLYLTGIYPILSDFLDLKYSKEIQFEALWIITNIVSDEKFNYPQTSDYIDHLVNVFINSPFLENQIQALWALGNISGDMDTIPYLTNNRFFPVMYILIDTTIELYAIRLITWSLCILLKNKHSGPYVSRFIPSFKKILSRFKDEEIISNTCWILYYITISDSFYEEIKDAGIIQYLISFLSCGMNDIVLPCSKALGNFATGDDKYTQLMIECGLVEKLIEFLTNETSPAILIKECCWTISNILAGDICHTNYLLDKGIDYILEKLFHKTYSEIQKEIAFCIYNIVWRRIPGHTERLFSSGLFECLILCLNKKDSEIIKISLESLSKISVTKLDDTFFKNMEENISLMDQLETLSYSNSKEITVLSQNILDLVQN